MDWVQEQARWPLGGYSRFIGQAAGQWHLQTFGACRPGDPIIVLLHGTGASTHSWRAVALPLQAHLAGTGCSVVSLDLPGHGFSSAGVATSLSLPDVAAALIALMKSRQWHPALLVGHSAGAAIALQMNLLGMPSPVISLNGAIAPLHSGIQRLFSPMAKLLALNPLIPGLFALNAQRDSVVKRLLDSTGSQLDAEGRALYAKLLRDPSHAAGALQLMAQWNLSELWDQLGQVQAPIDLWVGLGDRTVDPAQVNRTQARLRHARIEHFQGLGHLMHEEQPEQFAKLIAQRYLAIRGPAPADETSL
jgi:magnesium chelatase accessory protein